MVQTGARQTGDDLPSASESRESVLSEFLLGVEKCRMRAHNGPGRLDDRRISKGESPGGSRGIPGRAVAGQQRRFKAALI